MTLQATSLTIRYPGRGLPALQGASLRLDPGELAFVVGPNGSGKTTLQRALLGLTKLEQGRVFLDGLPIEQWKRADLAARIGALPQREEPVWPVAVRQSVAMGRWLHLPVFGDLTPADQAAIDRAMERADLLELSDRRIDTLSGGEWQRVRLARALAGEPAFLLLDEPTAALDISHQMQLLELLRSLADEGLGILVITHDLDLAVRFADRMLILKAGRIVADGTPEAILTPELLASVFDWQIDLEITPDGTPRVTPRRHSHPSPIELGGTL